MGVLWQDCTITYYYNNDTPWLAVSYITCCGPLASIISFFSTHIRNIYAPNYLLYVLTTHFFLYSNVVTILLIWPTLYICFLYDFSWFATYDHIIKEFSYHLRTLENVFHWVFKNCTCRGNLMSKIPYLCETKVMICYFHITDHMYCLNVGMILHMQFKADRFNCGQRVYYIYHICFYCNTIFNR